MKVNQNRRMLFLLITLALTLLLFGCSQRPIAGSDWTYNPDSSLLINKMDKSLILENITVNRFQGNRNITIGENWFNSKRLNVSLDLSGEITDSSGNKYQIESIDERAFLACTGISELKLPDSLVNIGNQAFSYCIGISELKLPDSLVSIGYDAFAYCTGISELRIPQGITEISNGVFNNCSSITNLVLPDGLTTIGNQAFANCIGISELKLPNSITKIGDQAFADCTSIVGFLTIPANVQVLGYEVFYHSNISEIRFEGAIPPKIGFNMFQFGDFNTRVICPPGSVKAYSLALKIPETDIVESK